MYHKVQGTYNEFKTRVKKYKTANTVPANGLNHCLHLIMSKSPWTHVQWSLKVKPKIKSHNSHVSVHQYKIWRETCNTVPFQNAWFQNAETTQCRRQQQMPKVDHLVILICVELALDVIYTVTLTATTKGLPVKLCKLRLTTCFQSFSKFSTGKLFSTVSSLLSDSYECWTSVAGPICLQTVWNCFCNHYDDAHLLAELDLAGNIYKCP